MPYEDNNNNNRSPGSSSPTASAESTPAMSPERQQKTGSSSAPRKPHQNKGSKGDPAPRPDYVTFAAYTNDYSFDESFEIPFKVAMDVATIGVKLLKRYGGKPSVLKRVSDLVRNFVKQFSKRKSGETYNTWSSFMRFCKQQPGAPKDFSGCKGPYNDCKDVYKGVELNDDAMRKFIEERYGKGDDGNVVQAARGKGLVGGKAPRRR